MFFDVLVVFVFSLISSLFICTSSVHGLPLSSTKFHYVPDSPSTDLSNSLRLVEHRPASNIDIDPTGNNVEMLIGHSNENDHLSSSSVDITNDPFDYYLQESSPSSLKFLPRNFLLLSNQDQEKRSSPSSSKMHSSINIVPNEFADLPLLKTRAVNMDQSNEAIRLSPSLKNLVETNPIARIWLKMLVQKLMQEQSTTPYIFKYGRRRK